jgi:hypothetical protein
VQNTLGYSPVQAGLRFLPLFLLSFAVALLTATSTWLVLQPGFILAGIGLGVTSTGLASAALSAVEPAHAGMAAGLVNIPGPRKRPLPDPWRVALSLSGQPSNVRYVGGIGQENRPCYR